MKRPLQIAGELAQIQTIGSLTGVFEEIASIRIAKIKDQVLASYDFFTELWRLYSQLRVEAKTPVLKALAVRHHIKRTAMVLITSEGGLNGDIDERVVNNVKSEYRPDKNDIIVIGNHGLTLLQQAGIPVKKYYRLPSSDKPVNAAPVIATIDAYEHVEIYYQKFISLAQQKVDKMALFSVIKPLGQAQIGSQNVITPKEYIFEPSIEEVVVYLETVMLEISLGQTILESRLSQLASRFNAMSQAQNRAEDLEDDMKRAYFAAKRARSDERIREATIAMRSL